MVTAIFFVGQLYASQDNILSCVFLLFRIKQILFSCFTQNFHCHKELRLKLNNLQSQQHSGRYYEIIHGKSYNIDFKCAFIEQR